MKHPFLVLVSVGVELPFENQRWISFSPIRLHRCTQWVVYSHSKALTRVDFVFQANSVFFKILMHTPNGRKDWSHFRLFSNVHIHK